MTKKNIKLINGKGAGASTPHVNQPHFNRYTDLEISDMRIRYNEIQDELAHLRIQKEALIQTSLQYQEFTMRRSELNEIIKNIKVEIVSRNFALRLLHERITSHRPQITEFNDEGGGIKNIITGTGSGASSLPEQKTFTNREIVDMQMSLIVLQEDLIKVTSDIRKINLTIHKKNLPRHKRNDMKNSLEELTYKKNDIEEEIKSLSLIISDNEIENFTTDGNDEEEIRNAENIKVINGKGAGASVLQNVPRDIQYEIAELNRDRNRILTRMNILNTQKKEAKKLLNELIKKSEPIENIRKEIESLSLIISGYNRELIRIDNEIENFTIDGNDDEEEEEIRNAEGKGLKSSKWIDHVKAHSKTHNISYKQALKAAKESYKK